MAENKFIKHLKGTETAGSVLEIKNQATPATFGNMPSGTSNPNTAYADARGDATGVLKGTDNWKLDGSTLTLATQVYGDGRDFTDTYTASGSSLWINATYTFTSAKIFGANTKWVLKLCGANLLSAVADTIDFSLIIKFGSTPLVTKTFSVAEQANNFCQQFVIDFNEWTQNVLKATSGDTLTIQLLCGDSTASATIYNGMTTLTALQRRVDGDVVASDTSTFDDLEQGLAGKVDKTSTPSVVYGTDATGAQTTYDVDDFGQVDDVQIDGVSIVQNKIADIPMSTYLGDYLLKTGGTLTGDLAFQYNTSYPVLRIIQSGQNTNHLRFINNSYASQSISFDLSQAAIHPLVSGRGHLGTSDIHFGDAYIDKVYTGFINNGYDIAVPVTNSADTLALKSEVDLAANSGTQLTNKGVWYAKMYAATVVPSAEDGTNYADFSQTDGNGDPIIVIYERQNGAWVQTQTITPPANYNGYVTVTSKIWDIVEQTGQQGGKVLWSYNQKTFTPYPQIISFEDAALTGNSTVAMPLNPTNDNITNKGYVDTAIAGAIASVSPWDLFDFKWKDCAISKSGWALSDGNWKTSVAAFNELFNDIYTHTTWYVSDQPLVRTYSPTPTIGDTVYYEPYPTTEAGTVTAYDDVNNTITVSNGYTYAYNSNQYVTPTTETVAGITVTYYPGTSGRKIVAYADMTAVESVYTATGVAWYYIIDISGKQFKLPRTQHAFVGYRDAAGGYVAPALPNIKGLITSNNWAGSAAADSALYPTGDGTNSDEQGHGPNAIGFNAHRHNAIYQDSATVQPPATQMYLYFYVGA